MSERHVRRCIDKVGDTAIAPLHRLSCHCGAVQIDLELPQGIVDPRRCNCSKINLKKEEKRKKIRKCRMR